MLLEIFEKATISSEPTQLDKYLDLSIEHLLRNGVEVKRYDKNLEPEIFERVRDYALPVVMFEGEILSAGAYDFRSLEQWISKKNNCNHVCSACDVSCQMKEREHG